MRSLTEDGIARSASATVGQQTRTASPVEDDKPLPSIPILDIHSASVTLDQPFEVDLNDSSDFRFVFVYMSLIFY